MKTVYEIVTDKIINMLDQGTVPWHRPWNKASARPMNLISGAEYKGINFWNTALSGYSSKYWLSFKQGSELGGSVRKGEKGTPIVYFKMLEKEKNGEIDTIPLARYSTVFNLDQFNGLDTVKAKEIELRGEVVAHSPIDSCEKVVRRYFGDDEFLNPLKLVHEKDSAFYSKARDIINMPLLSSFHSAEEYYSTLFHEMVHSTGHETRLNRPELIKVAAFASHEYSKEELVAEMGSAYLCADSGISMPVIANQASYIASWLDKLKNDRSLLVSAASKAEKACSFIYHGSKERQEKEGAK